MKIKLTQNMKILCKGISKTADIKPYGCGRRWWAHRWQPHGFNVFSMYFGMSYTTLQCNITYEEEPTTPPCIHGETKRLTKCIHVLNIPMDSHQSQQDTDTERGQINTGTWVSSFNKLHIFQNCKLYSWDFWCSVWLNTAIKQGTYIWQQCEHHSWRRRLPTYSSN